MFGFTYFTPTKVVFGRGTEAQTGALVREQGGTKVLVLSGGGSAERSGLLGRVRASLDGAGLGYVSLSGVVPNPRLSLVRRGIELCRRERVDFLLAVGGGSVIDSVKAIGYGLANEGDVWDFYEHTRRPSKCMPLGAVLTIAATGSEMSNSSVITREETGEKRSYNDDLARPRFAVMNPELTLTLPAYQTECGCADILMHTMERYFTTGGNMELTDAMAEALMRTVMAQARVLRDDPSDYDARAEVMWAGSLSHNGLTGCGSDGGDFATHMLEHEVGGMFDVAHGAGLTALWGSWARYVYRDCLPRFLRFAGNVMGVPAGADAEETALRGIAAAEDFFRSIGMPTSFRELGLVPTEAQMADMARRCAAAAGGHKGSARVLYEPDMLAIYRAAL